MNAAELAALIAAVFWALLVCVGVFVLFRLGRLLSESSFALDAFLDRLGRLVHQRLGLLEAQPRGGTDDLDHLDLLVAGSGQDDVDGARLLLLGRTIAGGPVGRIGALAYGVRHAVSRRNGRSQRRRALPATVIENGLAERGELTRGEAAR